MIHEPAGAGAKLAIELENLVVLDALVLAELVEPEQVAPAVGQGGAPRGFGVVEHLAQVRVDKLARLEGLERAKAPSARRRLENLELDLAVLLDDARPAERVAGAAPVALVDWIARVSATRSNRICRVSPAM